MAEAQLPEGDEKGASAGAVTVQDLVSEHHALDERLRRLAAQQYLSTEQQRTEAVLKKHKLALKDRIARLEREQAQQSRSA